MLLLVTILLSLITLNLSQPAICPDKCNTTNAKTCVTYNSGFNAAAAGTSCWFNIAITNPGSFSPGFSFTSQTLTIGGTVITPGNDALNLNGASPATTSYGSGWTTNAGTGCGTIFLGGVVVPGPFSQGTTFTWCGVFQSNTQFATALSWSVGAACYKSPPFPTSTSNSLKVVASTGCPTTNLPAGTDWL
jgi:hypothetical protein